MEKVGVPPLRVEEEKHSWGVSWGLSGCRDIVLAAKAEGEGWVGGAASATGAGWGFDQKSHATVRNDRISSSERAMGSVRTVR